MRNIHYKVRSFRLAEKVYAMFKKKKPKELSWNLFFKKIIKLIEEDEQRQKTN